MATMQAILPHQIREQFRQEYRTMLKQVVAQGRPTFVCTIYDAVPGLQAFEKTALTLFNEAILREAFEAGVGVLDLRLICTLSGDYAASSPIEPSDQGGRKIAAAIGKILTGGEPRSRLFA